MMHEQTPEQTTTPEQTLPQFAMPRTKAFEIAARLVEFRRRDGCSAAVICAMALDIGYNHAVGDIFEYFAPAEAAAPDLAEEATLS